MPEVQDVIPGPANLAETHILDHGSREVQALKAELERPGMSPREFVQAAHRHFGEKMRAYYSIDEDRPVSETLRLNAGSCGQRMAAVEALARAAGVATRVRALWLRREFWNSRLPLLRFFLPKRTLMPWPQFHLEGRWVDFDELFGTLPELAARTRIKHPFTNRGVSLYDAVRDMPVDFLGKLRGTPHALYDISHRVAADEGFHDTRDQLLATEKKPGRLGRFLFDLLYGGRDIRRIKED
ncbi:MAG TPA: transglutaminase domain-containing protein [Pyrinomonadaceae bacterium]|nr:transglutaminase domain-containing protein [Pyrinomonadaceae bacterium]